MKKYFAKYLPVEGDIKSGDKVNLTFKPHQDLDDTGLLVKEVLDESYLLENNYNTYKKHCNKVKLFLCTREIEIGDKVFSFINGHCDDVEISPFHEKVYWDTKDFTSGWPDEPHTILDLNHSDYKPYRIRTEHGYGSPGRYIKVIGEISSKAIWVKEQDEFDEEDWILSGWYDYVGDGYHNPFGELDILKGKEIDLLKNPGKWIGLFIKLKSDKSNTFH